MTHPETDQDFRSRILQVVLGEDKIAAMTTIGGALDALGRVHGMARKGLPEGAFADPILRAFRLAEEDKAVALADAHGTPRREPDEDEAAFRARAFAYWFKAAG